MPNDNMGFSLSDSMDMLSLNDIVPSPSKTHDQRYSDIQESLDVSTISPKKVQSQPDHVEGMPIKE